MNRELKVVELFQNTRHLKTVREMNCRVLLMFTFSKLQLAHLVEYYVCRCIV